MFLILSAMTAQLECGAIFLGMSLGYSPEDILALCFAYQLGNLFPIPFSLNGQKLKSAAYLSLIILCLAPITSTFPELQGILYFLGILLLSCTLQCIRATNKKTTRTSIKRLARVLGFILAPLMLYISYLLLPIYCLTILWALHSSLKTTPPAKNTACDINLVFTSPYYQIMLWHQLHYFIYAYSMILIAYELTRNAFLTMLCFACTWLTYLITEPIIRYKRPNLKNNTYIIFAGHIFLFFILMLLPNVKPSYFIILWILTGFGGGTVFAITGLCMCSKSYSSNTLTLTENIGHVVGTAIALLWIAIFPNNIISLCYLSALCVAIVLLLTYKIKKHK